MAVGEESLYRRQRMPVCSSQQGNAPLSLESTVTFLKFESMPICFLLFKNHFICLHFK